MSVDREIFVYFDDCNANEPTLLGKLLAQETRGKEFFSFAFSDNFLRQKQHVPLLDPELQFYAGAQYASAGMFGFFLDSCPDRWGRKLMQRRAATQARNTGKATIRLRESDYLLGVYDETRMGALRFKLAPSGAFQNDDSSMAVPPLARLRELEEASRHLEQSEEISNVDKWLNMLVAPGSSLGGARPKANVRGLDGELWIAKFPSHKDQSNVAAWEYATMLMARDCGINVPPCELRTLSRYGATFLVKRFDRIGERRIHFASAMTLLGHNDGIDSSDGASYLELAQFIIQNSALPDDDLHELWRRIVFSIAVSNTDDHLRNHGFLLTNAGWRLSPAYDINPNPHGQGLSLNISEEDNALDFALAMEVAPLFRLKHDVAEQIIMRVKEVVTYYRDYAEKASLPRSEQDSMSPSFQAVLK